MIIYSLFPADISKTGERMFFINRADLFKLLFKPLLYQQRGTL